METVGNAPCCHDTRPGSLHPETARVAHLMHWCLRAQGSPVSRALLSADLVLAFCRPPPSNKYENLGAKGRSLRVWAGPLASGPPSRGGALHPQTPPPPASAQALTRAANLQRALPEVTGHPFKSSKSSKTKLQMPSLPHPPSAPPVCPPLETKRLRNHKCGNDINGHWTETCTRRGAGLGRGPKSSGLD